MKVTAIDFETANGNPASVCAVGISVMEDGCVEEAYYSLIRPESNVSWFAPINVQIHGIRPEDVEDAPDFRTVLNDIRPFFEDAIVCAHNARFGTELVTELFLELEDIKRKVFIARDIAS